MYPVGRINSYRAALAFRDYLKSQGISTEVHPDGEYTVIQVASQNQLETAREELNRFLANPEDGKYWNASWSAGDTSSVSPVSAASGFTPILKNVLNNAGIATKALMLVSTVITLFTGFGMNLYRNWFTFNPELIVQGEIHRLITPIFLHFPVFGIIFLHLVFNMLWLWDLGGKLEKRLGSMWLMYMVFVVALISNLSQWIVSGPNFGGMSGVVFGLLGYLWIRGEIDARLGFKLNSGVLVFLLLWMALGFAGIIGGMANTAHLAGFLAGAGLAWLDVKVFKLNRYYR